MLVSPFFVKILSAFFAAFLIFSSVSPTIGQVERVRRANRLDAPDENKVLETLDYDASLRRDTNAPVEVGLRIDKSDNVGNAAPMLDALPNANFNFQNGSVRASALQADGKLIVAGNFKTLNGIPSRNIVRLNADYSIDSSFTASTNATVLSVIAQPDGKILIGGSFTVVDGSARSRIARLNSNGSLDSSFNAGSGADNTVFDVFVQSDGKILLGGLFNGAGGSPNVGVTRLNSDGSSDTTFRSPLQFIFPDFSSPSSPSNVIYSIAQQQDGKIIIGGTIVTSMGNPPNTSYNYSFVKRLNVNGSFDSSFAANPSGTVRKVAVQQDGKILLGGSFSRINNVSRAFLGRLNADGSLDAAFNGGGVGPNSSVSNFFLQPDGSILLVGNFSAYNGANSPRLAKIKPDGSFDSSLILSGGGIVGSISTILQLSDSRILLGGSFSVSGAGGNSTLDTIALVNQSGALDTSKVFRSIGSAGVRSITTQADGKFLVGGDFNRIDGVSRAYLARFNADGTLDSNFDASAVVTGSVSVIKLQSDGKILLGGDFFALNETSTTAFVRLNADGSLDSGFNASVGAPADGRTISSISIQTDGKILYAYNISSSNGMLYGGVARLNADGAKDSTITGGAGLGAVRAVVALPDGKFLIGGEFSIGFINSQTGNVFYNNLHRANTDGSLDRTFRAEIESSTSNDSTSIYSIAVLPDNKILIGGHILTGEGIPAYGVARLNADGKLDGTFYAGAISGDLGYGLVRDLEIGSNGKITISGSFNNIAGTVQSNIGRLNADGSLDSAFEATTNDVVYDAAFDKTGKLLIGGYFDAVNGSPRTALARLSGDSLSARKTAFDFDGDGRADLSVTRTDGNSLFWYLLNSQTGFTATQFGIASDKITPADFDGDGKTDVAVFRDGNWYWLNSSNGAFNARQFGQSGDVPVPADYTGDGRAELAVYRNGNWFTSNLVNNEFQATQFGVATDKTVQADYDGDGRVDIAVVRRENGQSNWYVLGSTRGFTATQFGIDTDKPVPADYDGDGKADVAVFRSGNWYAQGSTQGFRATQFGVETDVLVPADYDGDGRADLAVTRVMGNSTAWYLLRSRDGFTGVNFGVASDAAVPAAFIR